MMRVARPSYGVSLLAGLSVLLASVSFARADEESDLSLDDILKISVASKTPMTVNDSPGLVTVITSQEIKDSGARDLDDILITVPGFQIAVDYDGILSVGLRGLWALEGKIMIMLDGQRMNDLVYNEFIIGNRLPLDQIDRIEIIRGPGSAIYGDSAEYGVINVITKTGAQMAGATVTGVYGQFDKSYAMRNLSLGYGNHFGKEKDDLDFSVKAMVGSQQRSDSNRSYPDGTSLTMIDAYVNNPLNLNVGATYKGLATRFIVDLNHGKAQDIAGTAFTQPFNINFDNYVFDLKYDWKLASNLTFTPEYNFMRSYSYFNNQTNLVTQNGQTAAALASLNFDLFVDRHKLVLPFSYNPIESLNFIVGFEQFLDIGQTVQGLWKYALNPNNTNDVSSTISYRNRTLYAQGIWLTPYGNLTSGVRYENNDLFGEALVPRFGYTKSLGDWNFKALLSYAFRFPSLGNADYATTPVLTEKTRAIEFEVGHSFSKNHQVRLAVFDTLVTNPITWAASQLVFVNYPQTGSRGLELEYKTQGELGYGKLGYSFYTANGINQDASYAVQQDLTQLSSFAPHKVTLAGSINLGNRQKFNPTVIFLSDRYAYGGNGASLSTQLLPACLLMNAFYTYDDFLTRGLDLGAGIYNILATNFQFGPAYDLGVDPLPGWNREYLARLSYHF